VQTTMESLDDETKRVEALRLLLSQELNLAPAWKDLASITENDRVRVGMIEKGLAGSGGTETKGMLEIKKALLGILLRIAMRLFAWWASWPATQIRLLEQSLEAKAALSFLFAEGT
jgi:hypothetical protein